MATVTCPNCGAQSKDPEWCDVCGAQLNPPRPSVPWLEVGAAFSFNDRDDVSKMARVVDLLEVYSTRRVGLARVCPPEQEGIFFTKDELQVHERDLPSEDDTPANSDANAETCEFPRMSGEWPIILFEETINEPSLQPTNLPDTVRAQVYTPFARQERGTDRVMELFTEPEGAPLQEYLESLGRLLTLEEAAGVALLLMDAVEKVHDAGLYHFQICPWTIRVVTTETGEETQDDNETEADDKDDGKDNEEEQQTSDAEDTREEDTKEMAGLRLIFEGIRGFYSADAEIRSHPVIMGFSPPEFFGRSQGALDRHADIFATGMLFYYLLAGGPPPSGSLTRNTPCLPVRAYRFPLPPGLQPFIDGCTHPEPEERFNSIAKTRKALLAALDVNHRRSVERNTESNRVSIYAAVDRHIGIGKGRRSPINQDAVFLGHDPDMNLALISIGDGVSTASFGSGDIASSLLVESSARSWLRRHELKRELVQQKNNVLGTSETIELLQLDLDTSSQGAGEVIVLEDGEDDEDDDSLDPNDIKNTIDEVAANSPPSEEGEEDDSDTSEDEDSDESDDSEAMEEPDASEVTADSGDDSNYAQDQRPANGQADMMRGRIGLTGNRSAPPYLDTPASRFIQDVLTEANNSISAHINERFAPFNGPVHEVMGTTSVLAIVHGDQVTLSSLGDSRVYLLREGHMERLTRDHNLTTLRMIEGFSADESLLLPHGKALARCLGTFQVSGGHLQAIDPEPDLVTFRLLPGDTLLLTTDGLVDFGGPTEAAAERNIQNILESEEIPAIACLKLIVLANEGGGEDNIGLAVVRVTEHQKSADRSLIVQAFPPTSTLRT